MDHLPARIEPGHPHPGPHLPAAGQVDLVRAFLSGRKPTTLRAYQADLADFARFVGASGPGPAVELLLAAGHGPANGIALDYRNDLAARGLSSATIARRLAALRSMVKLARTLGRVGWALDVEAPKVARARDVRGPGLVGFARMLGALDGRADAKGVRDRAMLRLLWGLALRRGELVSLDLADVDLDGARLAVLGKGRSDREWLTLPEGAKVALVAWLDVRGREPGPLFVSLHLGRPGGRLTADAIHEIIRALGKAAGLDRPTRPHGIRHASITEVARRTNGNSVATQRFGRHRSPATTSRYIDEVEDTFGKMAGLVDGALG